MERQAHFDHYIRVIYDSLLSQEVSFKYWPEMGQNVEFGTFVIETISEEPLGESVIKRIMKITHVETVRT